MAAEDGWVAGYEDRTGEFVEGHWDQDALGRVEYELETSERIVVAFEDADHEVHYFTTSYLTDDYPLDEVIADMADRYGISFA